MARKRRDFQSYALLERIHNKTLNPASLDSRQRKLLVLALIREDSTITLAQIARIIGVSESQASRIRHLAIKCTSFDVDSEVRELVNLVWMKSGEYQRRAIRANDPGTAWKVFRESIELLQGLGFVFEAPKKIALAHFDGTADLGAALKKMFSETGVPTMPEFIERLKQMSAGGNGNGNGNKRGHETVLALPPTGGNGGTEPGNGKGNGRGPIGVVLPERGSPGDRPDGEKGGPPNPSSKPPQNG